MAVYIHGLIKELTDHLKTPNEKSTSHLKSIQASYMLSTTLTFSFSVIIIGYILLIKLNGRYSYVFSFYTKPIIECKLMRDCNFLTREQIGTRRVSSDLQLYIVSEIFMFYVLEKRWFSDLFICLFFYFLFRRILMDKMYSYTERYAIIQEYPKH